MKQNRIRKCLRAAALAVVALILVLAGTVFALWHNEFATLGSFRKLSDRDTAHHDGAVYELTVSGDYYFDDFLAQGGASNDSELISFVTKRITKGSFRCSSKPRISPAPLLRRTRQRATGCLAATMIFLPPIRPSSTPTPARGAMLPTPPWTCTSSAWTRTKTWRAWGISS